MVAGYLAMASLSHEKCDCQFVRIKFNIRCRCCVLCKQSMRWLCRHHHHHYHLQPRPHSIYSSGSDAKSTAVIRTVLTPVLVRMSTRPFCWIGIDVGCRMTATARGRKSLVDGQRCFNPFLRVNFMIQDQERFLRERFGASTDGLPKVFRRGASNTDTK